MRVADVMTTKLVVVPPTASFKAVAELMVDNRLGALPVVDEEGRLLGIVSESDMLPKEAKGCVERAGASVWDVFRWEDALEHDKASSLTAADLMTAPVDVALPDELLRSVAQRMLDGRLRRLPVVDRGRLVGIVTRGDILRVFARPDASIKTAVERVLAEHGYASPPHDLEVEVVDDVVTLRGLTATIEDVCTIGALAAEVEGVVAVNNLLGFEKVEPPPPRRGSHEPRPV